MLKLTVEVGESLLIGDDIKVVFTGGTSNYARVLVEGKRDSNTVIKKNGIYPRRQKHASMRF